MRFCKIRKNEAIRLGIVEADVIDLLPTSVTDLGQVIDAYCNRPGQIEAWRVAAAEQIPLFEASLTCPVGPFQRDVLCTGWNYWDHFEEGIGKRDGQEVERPTAPTFFNKAPGAIIGPYDPIAFDPHISKKWDYEGEIVIIIGKEGRSIPAHKAMEHVFGYTLANDVSQRDLQRRHGGQWFKGKSIDETTPIGPYITTADDIDLPNTRIETFVNGEKRQDAYVRQMAFSIEQLIAELSFGMTLFPGDVILTGTPSGIGMAMTPPVFLKDGDEIVVQATGLGALKNRVTLCDLHGQTDIVIDR